MRKSVPFLILFFCLLQGVFAQKREVRYPATKFRNFSMGEGLSMSTIMGIAQTKDGYLWFATPDKLNRFDGYEFKTFKHEQGKENSLSDNYLTALLALSDGSLLIATNQGYIDRYVNKYNKFTHYNIWDEKEEVVEIRGFCAVDSQTVLAFTMGGGICKINLQTGEHRWFDASNSLLPSNFAQALIRVDSSLFAVGTDAGISLFYAGKDSFAIGEYLSGYSVSSMALHKGLLYAGTGNTGLFTVDLKSEKTSRYFLGENSEEDFLHINLLLPDSRGNLWVGTTFDGLVRINADGSQSVMTKQATDNFSLINNTVYAGLEDNGGNIWIGTISGVSAYMPLNQQFAFYRPNPQDPHALSSKHVYHIYEDAQKRIWMGTLEGGLNLFDPKTERFRVFDKSNSKGLTSNSIRQVFQDSKMQLWVGTGDKGLFTFYPDAQRFEPVTDKKGNPLTQTPIRTIYQDKKGLIWIGTTEGLIAWNPETKEVFSGFRCTDGIYPPQVIYEIKQGRKSGLIWVASFGQGLFEFDLEKREYVRNYVSTGSDLVALNNNIMCMHKLGEDTLLLGTFGGGITVFDLKQNRFSSFSESDGLPNDAVYGLLTDKAGNWWVSTNRGIARVSPKDGKVKKFDRMEQIQSLEFNEGAYLSASDGKFYFGGIEGINVFDPLAVKTDEVAPLVHLTRVSIFDRTLVGMWNKDLKLAYTQNFLGFEYMAIGLLNPDKIAYSYMLEGVDEDWVEAGNRRFVQYTALGSGKYLFRVKAVNQEGVESVEQIALPFTILPPFWLTWWFLGLTAISLLLLLLAGYKFRVNRIRKEYQLKVTEVELKALRSQMNPHFIFNSINSIQYYILNKNPKIAYSYLTKFSSLMRKILQNSRLNYIPLAEELESLKLYMDLENIRIEGELQYSIELDPSINTKTMLIPSMVLQPFIENSIVHGLLNKEGEKRITVRVKKEISHLYCEIEDNGIGREKAKELNANRTKKHESTAMKATKERLELLNMENEKKLSINIIDLTDTKGIPTGTVVQVFIPFVKES